MLAMAIENSAGWLPEAGLAWWIAGAWAVVVVLYGVYRSVGDVTQDPIRPSGPLP